jgi:drug/metabolite transporter (DMT)-like permease
MEQAAAAKHGCASRLRPIDLTAVVCLTLCCAVWGLNQVAMKVTNAGISPLFQAGLRSGLAAVLVWLWATWRGICLFKADGSLWPGLTVGALFAGNFMFIGPGLGLTNASRGVLFLYAAPFMVAFGAHYLIAGERLTAMKLLGLTAAFSGLLLSGFGRDGSSGSLSPGQAAPPAQLIGDLYCFVAAAFWAATTLVVRTTGLRLIPPEKTLFYQLVVATPLLFAGAWVIGETGITQTPPLILGAFAFSTIVVVFVSYAVWFWLLQTYPAADVSVFTFLAPVFGVFAGHVLLAEPVGLTLAGALALVALGIALVTWSPKAPDAPA